MPFGDVVDVIAFNWGVHNLACDGTVVPEGFPRCWGVPGQSGNSTVYATQLEAIVQRLVAYAAAHPRVRLLFVATTPFLCTAQTDAAVVGLNAAAAAIMRRHAIPIADVYGALRAHCGNGTMAGCATEPSWGSTCFCPHCPPGYAWTVNNTLLPAVQALLAPVGTDGGSWRADGVES